jgi:hypothetical protein
MTFSSFNAGGIAGRSLRTGRSAAVKIRSSDSPERAQRAQGLDRENAV